jgi:hypothetical protein
MQRARGKRGTGASCRMSFVCELGGGEYFSILQKQEKNHQKLYVVQLMVPNSL